MPVDTDSGVWEEIRWDDIKNVNLLVDLVRAGRKEEVGFMENRNIWDVRDVAECWANIGAALVSARWVDTDKGSYVNSEWNPLVRCSLVGRDFKGHDRGRDDLFAEIPPLECKRILFSRAATRRKDSRWRKMMFVNARKAHLNI